MQISILFYRILNISTVEIGKKIFSFQFNHYKQLIIRECQVKLGTEIDRKHRPTNKLCINCTFTQLQTGNSVKV
jgi:hypothetical protein